MMSGEDFVQAVMRHLGVSSPAELAEEMKWKRGTERLVARWIAGSNKPSYERMWEMLERCGWLNMNGAPRKTSSEDQTDSGRLAALLATIDDLAAADEDILRRLEVVEKRVASTRRRASGE